MMTDDRGEAGAAMEREAARGKEAAAGRRGAWRRRHSASTHAALLAALLAGVLASWPIQGAEDPLAALGDEFDDPATLAGWALHHEAEGWPSQLVSLDIGATTPGHLVIVPEVSGWYEDFRGVLLFKLVTGDFIATARIAGTSLEGGIPAANFSLVGIMARAPRTITPATWTAGQENWVFINTGANGGQSVVETKTTRQSQSDLVLHPSQPGPIELRLERRGAEFTVSRRPIDGEWEALRSFSRPDLPATLQVGIDAYTDWDTLWAGYPGNPLGFNSTVIASPPGQRDLVGSVDWIRFETPCPPGGCSEGPAFQRGDVNADGAIDISDPVRVLLDLFSSPGGIPCLSSADTNDDGRVDISDALYALAAQFLGGPPLPAPSECGEDPTPDAVGCAEFPPCGA